MKRTIVILLLAVMLFSACEKSRITDGAPEQDQGTSEEGKGLEGDGAADAGSEDEKPTKAFSFMDLYNYGAVKSWVYIMESQGYVSRISTGLESSSYEGRSAWKMVSSVEMPGGGTTTTYYSDKATGGCLYSKTEIDVAGYLNTDEGCPENDPSSPGRRADGTQSELVETGKEKITVKAGTFDTTIYELKAEKYTTTYYYSPKVPIPVKLVTVAGSVSTSMELESYT